MYTSRDHRHFLGVVLLLHTQSHFEPHCILLITTILRGENSPYY
jgi:hypothetical protein